MMTMVNLLPWRASRRRARWRFWLLLLAGSIVLLCSSVTYLRQLAGLQTQHLRFITRQQQTLNHVLQQQVSAAQQQQKQQQQWQRENINREMRRQQTRAWQQILEQLADNLPADAWLCAIHYQQQQLRIEGYAPTPAALAGSARALHGLAGFSAPRATGTQRQADQWHFSFLLQRSTE